jgi:hypothetical protein
MNKKIVMVVQIDADVKYEYPIRAAIKYLQDRIVALYKGHMQIDEVKLQD